MSVNIDPHLWKLETAGGIPYKLVDGYPRGSLEEEDGGIEEKYIIEARNLLQFALESLSEYDVHPGGRWFYRPARSCPGAESLVTKRVAFEPFPPSLPGDPFGAYLADFDESDYSNTFAQFVQVTVSYSPGKSTANNPMDLIELSANATGEFLMYPNVGNIKQELIEPQTKTVIPRDAAGNLPSGSPSGPFPGQPGYDATQVPDMNGYFPKWPSDPNTLYNSGNKYRPLPPTVACTKVVPGMEWTAKFNRVPKSVFFSSLSLARTLLGKVNSTDMPIIHGYTKSGEYNYLYWNPVLAPIPVPKHSYQIIDGQLRYAKNPTTTSADFALYQETILFSGFSFSTHFTWRDSEQVASIEMKLLEKVVTEWDEKENKQVVKGHNHFFNPNTGKWERMMVRFANGSGGAGDTYACPVYETADLNVLFFGGVNNPQ